MILVSACLLGQSVRYDGRHSLCPELAARLAGRRHLALCPELLGGLAVPRPRARIEGAPRGGEGAAVLAGQARVVAEDGADLTAAFLAGARAVAQAARRAGVSEAWLKDRSPSCGCDPAGHNPLGGVGQGVLTALLTSLGIAVIEVRATAGGSAA